MLERQLMKVTTLSISLILSMGFALMPAQAEDAVFSGPQVGEKLPAFEIQLLNQNRGDDAATESATENAGRENSAAKSSGVKGFDPTAGDGPVLLVFFHELTRPGFGLTRAIASFAAKRADQGMKSSVIFLTDDPTSTRKWATNVRQHFADGVNYGISMDGDEGPGAYGLNRNVTLTILVGQDGKVTSNFALVQPQLQADGPEILQAIADVTGGGDVPNVADLEARYAGRNRMNQNRRGQPMADRATRAAQDPELTSLLRSVINKQASAEEVQEAAKKVEAYVEENASARKELTRIVNTVVNSGKIANYGTEAAQSVLRKWQATLNQDSTPTTEE
ncbi:MAG: hypothetical protein ACR2NZ_19190 [Rubripirellula sp.]